jgi:hypothetical protein
MARRLTRHERADAAGQPIPVVHYVMSFYIQTPDTYPRAYHVVPAEHPFGKYETRYKPAPPFIVHSKDGGTYKQSQPFVVRGMYRDELLVQKIGDVLPEGFNSTVLGVDAEAQARWRKHYSDGAWHTLRFDATVEGYRFVRTVRKAIELLVKLAREGMKTRNKVAKAERDFVDRGARCGICPCCFGDYVVHRTEIAETQKGKILTSEKLEMVHHGYERPGIGYIVGDCYGVGFEPFEVSCEGTKAWLRVIQSALTQRQDALAHLDTRDEITVDIKVRRNFRTGKSEIERKTLKRGEDGFDRAIARRRIELTAEITKIEHDIVEYGKRIVNWAPQPWPRVQKAASSHV